MDHWRWSFLPLCCTGWCVVCADICKCKKAGTLMLPSGTIRLDNVHIQYLHTPNYTVDYAIFHIFGRCLCFKIKHHFDFHETTATRQASTDTCICPCARVYVWESFWFKVCPQCSAAGGERCLCFLISLLLKKLLALSHVPSASGDNMTHAVVLV